MNNSRGFTESFSHVWFLEEAALTDTEVLQSDRLPGKESGGFYWKNPRFENDIRSVVFTLKAAYSHGHGGRSNGDAVSFDLYWIVTIGSGETISFMLRLDLRFLYPADFTNANLLGDNLPFSVTEKINKS